jgi:hypothetical protein
VAHRIGRKRSATFAVTALHPDFATRRRNVLPTAISRLPPSVLFRAHSETPQQTGCIAAGTRLVRHRLANSVRHENNRRPASPTDPFVKSFRCCGRRPSGPPADPRTKDWTAARMSVSSKHRVESLDDGGGIDESDVKRTGCLIRKASAVTSSNGAITSSLTARRMAPRVSPSWILLNTLAARSLGCRRRCDGFC